jgi:transposase
MQVVHERCAGLDVHKEFVMACARWLDRRQVQREVRRFATTTQGLLELEDWLQGLGCRQVGMEATGVYWKPVWHVLEGSCELVLANPAHMRNVPGRKSDMNDATWIAELLAHGLLPASFVPPGAIQELRDLTRTRRQLLRERVQHTQRIQRVLEDANVKLSVVISDVLGASGRRMLQAMVAGENDPARLAVLGSNRLECSREQLQEALRGRITAHHRFLLGQHLATVDHLDQTIERFDAEIARALEPFRVHVELLKTIPGISDTAAQVVVAEIGVDMTRFPTVDRLLSWAGLCPSMNQSAGKRGSTRVRKGAPWLKPVLVQCALAAGRKKASYTQAQFLRLRARRGPRKAAVAVAATLLGASYFILRDRIPYQDLGADHFVRRDRQRVAQRLTNRLRDLGYEVTLKVKDAA